VSSVEETCLTLAKLAEEGFPDIVVSTEMLYGKLRLHLSDGSHIDVWLSRRLPGRYAYHWERRHIDGTIYRHDNRPHVHLRDMRTYPRHFHNGTDERVEESHLPDDHMQAIRSFLEFARNTLKQTSTQAKGEDTDENEV